MKNLLLILTLVVAINVNAQFSFNSISNTSSNGSYVIGEVFNGSSNGARMGVLQIVNEQVNNQDDTPTSITKYKSLDIAIYPNPSSDLINFDINSKEFNVFIFDNKGSIVIQSKNNKSLSISELEVGIYHVKIVTNSTIYTSKIKKN